MYGMFVGRSCSVHQRRPVSLNLSCEAADWKLLITLNGCNVFFWGADELAALLWVIVAVCGVQGAGCGHQLLLTPPFASSSPTDVTVRCFVCTHWYSISKFGALALCFSLSLDLITVSQLLAQVWFGCFAVAGIMSFSCQACHLPFPQIGCIKMSAIYPQWLTLLVPAPKKTNIQRSSIRMMRCLPPSHAFQAQSSPFFS